MILFNLWNKLENPFSLSREAFGWKKVKTLLFDVIVGSHDGAEVCELVGISLLGKLSNIIDKEENQFI